MMLTQVVWLNMREGELAKTRQNPEVKAFQCRSYIVSD